MFCPNCGTQLGAGVNFCPNCGTRVSSVTTAVDPAGYMVMLVSVGDCVRTNASALLQQICGYAPDEALLIIDNAPITIARNLTDAQARFLAQALAEYGMEVSVYDGSGWRDWESTTTSVWDQTGALVTGVAAALGLISLNNRITRDMMHRTDYPYRFTGARPPVYRLHNTLRVAPPRRPIPAPVRPPVHRAPAPGPRMAPPPPPPRPAPGPAPRPAPGPAPRPPQAAPGPRPAPGPGPRPGPGPGVPGGRPGGVPGGRPGGGSGRRGG